MLDLLEQEVREPSAIDVARRDRRDGRVLIRERQRRAVECDARDAREFAGVCAIEHDRLAATAVGVRWVAWRLAIHAHIARAFLDDSIGLARDDEGILGEADVERLARPAQRQRDAMRFARGGRGRRDRALKRGDRAAERFAKRCTGLHAARDQRRDHLRVGRDLVRDGEPVLLDQLVVVVDVTVQHADAVGRAARSRLFAVERVRVGLADHADAGPARVAEHERFGAFVGEQRLEQLIALQRRAQRAHVVAEFADLRRVLVGEVDDAVVNAHGPMHEQRVVCARLAEFANALRAEVESAQHHADARGVAAAHFESVERAQRSLDAGPRRRRGQSDCAGAREFAHGFCVRNAILPNGPQCVLESHERRVAQFDLFVDRVVGALVERSLERSDLLMQRAELRLRCGRGRWVCEQAHQAGHAAQLVVERAQRRGSVVDVACGEACVQRAHGVRDRLLDNGCRRRATTRLAPQHGDDATHGCSDS